MKKITDNQETIELVSKLVKDGAIDFAQAIKLMEVEVEKEYVYVPNFVPYTPPTIPLNPVNPWYQVGCGIGGNGNPYIISDGVGSCLSTFGIGAITSGYISAESGAITCGRGVVSNTAEYKGIGFFTDHFAILN